LYQQVQSIQNNHMDDPHKKWGDIGYNFMIGGDGGIYECRGWSTVGAHTFGYNRKSIGIGLIGNFQENIPTQEQMNALRILMAVGVQLGKVSHNYQVFGHCQLRGSTSPGRMFFRILKTWPHWNATDGRKNNGRGLEAYCS
jgi:peptidoglycan recognition protein LE